MNGAVRPRRWREAAGAYAEGAVLAGLRKALEGKKYTMDAVLFNDLVCSDWRPALEHLDWHAKEVFKGAARLVG